MFRKVLIANRGAIACRVIRTLRRMGIASVSVYSDADTDSLHVSMADEAVPIGPAPAAQSYLNIDRILEAARTTGAEAIHPGYGFLSENPDFVEACAAAGIVFIGPRPEDMRRFGLKHTAREIASREGVPLLPGSGLLSSIDEALSAAEAIGYPVMLKSTAGGGGIGMQLCHDPAALKEAFDRIERLSRANFGEGGLFLEKFVERARHIEVQIFGDGRGHVVALGERDCSVQRRNQKIIEETPAPGLTAETRRALLDGAARLGQSIGYTNAGTVEFVYDDATGAFYFLEVNTRLQVEHGVTEEVTGIDLVEWMILQAAGELDLADFRPRCDGASIQARLYCEDPGRGFQPSTGVLTECVLPAAARVETWVERGTEVTPYYDPMLAKIIVRGADRAAALTRMRDALATTRIGGVETNLRYLRQILNSEAFTQGAVYTRMLETIEYRTDSIEVVDGGTQTTVQDFPGRLGYWDVGVPPSGPMDSLAFRLANRIVGNPESAAGLECLLHGATVRFNTDAVIALTGAQTDATLDGSPVPFWQSVTVSKGQTLRIGSTRDCGMRTYLAIRRGLNLPLYLGSRSTFTLGGFGGHAGRALRTGDILHLADETPTEEPAARLAESVIPRYTHDWEIRVLYGPHGAPDFFEPADIADLFSTTYEVHFNSARTGVRLIGPRPRWARKDGGEAGLHPSNIHDNAYAIGAIDFTGDMPILLGPDGPSCGGFVCPATTIAADLWKLGQLRPGDKVRFRPVSAAEARRLEALAEAMITTLAPPPPETPGIIHGGKKATTPGSPVLHSVPAGHNTPEICYRRAGDKYVLVEYGPLSLSLDLRFRVQALLNHLEAIRVPGILDLTPGIRSLQVHYENSLLPTERLIELLSEAEAALPPAEEMEVPSRIVHLPLSWEDESTLLAIRKYMQTVRKDAPWCPSNIEFIRRINGLDSTDEVRDIVFNASYLVYALGDVYLGAPVATPWDPRHRLVTTKYNPARTWTPENAVGIGGAYLCIYGMEGPGGYQFVGRTIQMWNRWRHTADFPDGHPWLLRFFDQIRFFEVTHAELQKMREDFPLGRYHVRTEETTLRLRDYHAFVRENAASISAFKTRQQAAFEAERRRWEASGQLNFSAESEAATVSTTGNEIPDGHRAVVAHVPGNVWKIPAKPGDRIEGGQPLVVLESMKMEVSIVAPEGGTLAEIRCREGAPVQAGDTLAILRPDA